MAVGLAAYGSAELATRATRLVSTVIVARLLAPNIVGEAALTLTLFELLRLFSRIGTGARIISCVTDDLPAVSIAAHRLFWRWSWLMVGAQVAVGGLLGWAFARPVAGAMLAALAPVYLFMAAGHVPYHRAMRAGLTKRLARIAAMQNIFDQLLTTLLVVIWPSPWAVALPKLLTAPLWTALALGADAWRPGGAPGSAPPIGLWQFSARLLLAEAMGALRSQGDNLIVAALLGTTALGTYYFAFNGGLGIVSSLVSAFGLVIFPLFCAEPASPARRQVLRRACVLGGVAFVPLILVQSVAAPWYVPLVFGHRWAFAAPLIARLCLAGLPLLLLTISCCWLRANGRPGAEAAVQAICCAMTLAGLIVGLAWGRLETGVLGLLIGQSIASVAIAVWALRRPRAASPPQLAEPPMRSALA